MAMMLSLNEKTKARTPSLYTQAQSFDWKSSFEPESLKFHTWMSTPYNEERQGLCHQASHGNLEKLVMSTRNFTAHLGLNLEWGSTPSFEWLLFDNDFAGTYGSFATHCIDVRDNEPSYVGKCLADLEWPMWWASKQWWEWGRMEENQAWDLLNKIRTLSRQYKAQGQSVKRIRELDAVPPQSMGEYRAQIDSLEAELMAQLQVLQTEPITAAMRIRVHDALMLKAGSRGGRTVDLHRIHLAVSHASQVGDGSAETWLQTIKKIPGNAYLARNKHSQWELLVVETKHHMVYTSAADLDSLLQLYSLCFPFLDYGDFLFTPGVHGARVSKAAVTLQFEDATIFGNYFAAVTKRTLGVALRPYDLRRMHAVTLRENRSSKEVKQSFAALMGTGVDKFEQNYDNGTALSKSKLAAEVQRHQFNPIFKLKLQNRVMPIIRAGLEVGLARLIRQEPNGYELFAIFDGNDYVELSSRFVYTASAHDFPMGLLSIQPDTRRQIWRQAETSRASAQRTFEDMGIGVQFCVESVVNAPPLVKKGDMVYVRTQCSLAEVLDDESDGNFSVNLAVEVSEMQTTSMEAYFRFEAQTKPIVVSRTSVSFPIDVSFNSSQGFFCVRKSMNLSSV